jgi:RHS repeat-associated protein
LFPSSETTSTCDPTRPPAYERRSAFEEYRYDALGRRVLVRTRSEFACQLYCLNTLRRIVWDGDQILYEISAPGGSSDTSTKMEADTALAVTFFLNQQHTAVTGFFPFGRVMYEHGGGIDAPLGVVRMEYSSELHDAQVIVPHNDWRGTYDRGTTVVGSCVVYSTNGTQLAPPPDSTPSSGDQYGGVVGGGTYSGTKEHCIDVDWPAAYTWSARQYRRGYSGPDSWMGSLIFESRDASGLYYRRNRYYDSEKGRFTQEDPIGLAGGVNVYGFAAGDPTTFTDPYGLQGCPERLPRRQMLLCLLLDFSFTTYGAMAGFNLGGGAAALETVGTGGPGAVAAPATVATTTALGAATGHMAAGVLSSILFNESAGSAGANESPERGPNETANFNYAVRELKIDPARASTELHQIKRAAKMGGAENVWFNTVTGAVRSQRTGEVIGNLLDAM